MAGYTTSQPLELLRRPETWRTDPDPVMIIADSVQVAADIEVAREQNYLATMLSRAYGHRQPWHDVAGALGAAEHKRTWYQMTGRRWCEARELVLWRFLLRDLARSALHDPRRTMGEDFRRTAHPLPKPPQRPEDD